MSEGRLEDQTAMVAAFATKNGFTCRELVPDLAKATTEVSVARLRGDMQELVGSLGGLAATIQVTSFDASLGPLARVGSVVDVSFAMPATIAFVPTLLCHDSRSSSAEQARGLASHFTGGQRLQTEHFESIALDRKFDVEVNPAQNAVWLRELFTPEFVDWLAEQAPPKLVVALDRGSLHVVVDEFVHDEASLAHVLDVSAHIATRIHDQCAALAQTTTMPLTSMAQAQAAERPTLLRKGAPKFGVGCASVGCAAMAGVPVLVGIAWVTGGKWQWAAIVAGVLAVITAVWVLVSNNKDSTTELHDRVGEDPELVAYAAKFHLQSEDPATFHARCASLDLPATARWVGTGILPVLGRAGSVAVATSGTATMTPSLWLICLLDDAGPVTTTGDLHATSAGTHTAVYAPAAPPGSGSTEAILNGFLTTVAHALKDSR